jgi:AraC-like DNA-binding protein
VLAYRRSFEMEKLDLAYSVVDLCHAGFRIRIERSRKMMLDDAMTYTTVGWSGYGERPRLDVVLEGQVRDTENGVVRHLGPGDFAIGRALDSLYQRAEREDFLCLAVEWNLGTLGTNAPIGLPQGTLNASDLSTLRGAVDQLSNAAAIGGGIGHEGLRSVLTVLSCLRAAGLPFESWRARDLTAEVPLSMQSAADVVGRALSRLDASPSSADLERELGVSRRQVGILVNELGTTYGLNGTDWRTMRDRWRLTAALGAMSHPDARTEDVARAVGYGSPNALCHAFRLAGLPTPGNVRSELARLG